MIVGLSEQGFQDDPQQFTGSVTNIKLFEDDRSNDTELTVKDLCAATEKNLIKQNSEWHFEGQVKIEEIKEKDVCLKSSFYKVGIAAPVNFKSSIDACNNIGSGSMTLIKTRAELNEVVSMFKDSSDDCMSIWTPISDERKEGKFKNWFTNESVSFLPWKAGAPNGGKIENNVFLDMIDNTYEDVGKNFKALTVCDVPTETFFTLAGFCEDTFMSKFG